MIDLTPLDVRKKKGDFRRGLRGYDPPHVDDFLDIVADRLEALVKENNALQDRLRKLEQQVADNREREKALTDTLLTAQEMREEMRTQMTREAESARRQAEQDAGRIRAEAMQAIERDEDTLRRLRARQLQFLQAYRTFLERELGELASMAKTLEANGAMSDPLDSLKSALPPLREAVRPHAEPERATPAAAPDWATSPSAQHGGPAKPAARPPAAQNSPPESPPPAAPPRPGERTAFVAGVAGASVPHAPPRVEPKPPAPKVPPTRGRPDADGWISDAAPAEELILSDDDMLSEPDMDSMFGPESGGPPKGASKPAAPVTPASGSKKPATPQPPSGARPLGTTDFYADDLDMPDPSAKRPPEPASPPGAGKHSNNLGLDLVPEFEVFDEFSDLEQSNEFDANELNLPPKPPPRATPAPKPPQNKGVVPPAKRKDSDDDPEDLLSSLFGDDH
jgi:cell division initiation protein